MTGWKIIFYGKCIDCGHKRFHHNLKGTSCHECFDNWGIPGPLAGWEHTFQLDNLKLIEDLASRKGLV